MKRCFKCGEDKPLDEFYRHPRMADGHFNKCKDCAKTDTREHRRVSERPREYDRERNHRPERRGRWEEKRIKYRYRNPEKYKAHNALNRAVKDGRVMRQTCEVCGEKAQAHHDDYSKPLDVRWLCPLHHARHHAMR